METLTIILNDAPYGDEKVWNARGLAKEELIEGVRVGTMIHLAQWIKQSQKSSHFNIM